MVFIFGSWDGRDGTEAEALRSGFVSHALYDLTLLFGEELGGV